MSMRELVIQRLTDLQHFDLDWSAGMSSARKSQDEQEELYRATLVGISDEDLLYDLLDMTKEKTIRDNREDELG